MENSSIPQALLQGEMRRQQQEQQGWGDEVMPGVYMMKKGRRTFDTVADAEAPTDLKQVYDDIEALVDSIKMLEKSNAEMAEWLDVEGHDADVAEAIDENKALLKGKYAHLERLKARVAMHGCAKEIFDPHSVPEYVRPQHNSAGAAADHDDDDDESPEGAEDGDHEDDADGFDDDGMDMMNPAAMSSRDHTRQQQQQLHPAPSNDGVGSVRRLPDGRSAMAL